MRRWYLVIACVLALVLATGIFGCAKPAPTPTPTKPAPAQTSAPPKATAAAPKTTAPAAPKTTPAAPPKTTTAPAGKVLSFATNPPGVTSYIAAVAISKAVTDSTPITVRVKPTSGASAAVAMAGALQADLAISDSAGVYKAYTGAKGFEHTPNVRWLFTAYPGWVDFFVKSSSDIQTMLDVKGKRVADKFSAQQAAYLNATMLLASAGLTWTDVKGVPIANSDESAQVVLEGRADVGFAAPSSAKATEVDAQIAGGIRWLPVPNTPESIANIQKVNMGSLPSLVKAGQFPTVRKDTYMLGFFSIVVAPKELEDDVVYQIVKAMWTKAADVAKAEKVLSAFQKEAMVHEGLTAPVHAGAIRFYKEVGVWNDKLEQLNQRLLKEQGQSK